MTTESMPAMDEEGFLIDPRTWTAALAQQLADSDGCELGDNHWLLIHLARDYYNRYHVTPGMRILVALTRDHYTAQSAEPARVDSRWLYRLFPASPARQICRYAGLPKPATCI